MGMTILWFLGSNKEAPAPGKQVTPSRQTQSENVSQLIDSLSDAHQPSRLAAVYGLAKIGPKASEAVPFLILSLTDEDHNVRAGSAYALQQIGDHAEMACPDLERVLRLDDYWPACCSGVALVTLTKSRAKLLALFRDILENGSDDARRATMFAIGNMGKDALSLTDSLITLLISRERYYIRRDAATTIGEIGVDNKRGLSALRKCLTDPNTQVRIASAAALWRITGQSQDALPVITREIGSKRDQVSETAIRALAKVGRPARGTVSLLVRRHAELEQEYEQYQKRIKEREEGDRRTVEGIFPGHDERIAIITAFKRIFDVANDTDVRRVETDENIDANDRLALEILRRHMEIEKAPK